MKVRGRNAELGTWLNRLGTQCWLFPENALTTTLNLAKLAKSHPKVSGHQLSAGCGGWRARLLAQSLWPGAGFFVSRFPASCSGCFSACRVGCGRRYSFRRNRQSTVAGSPSGSRSTKTDRSTMPFLNYDGLNCSHVMIRGKLHPL